jgi:hypothetical protein
MQVTTPRITPMPTEMKARPAWEMVKLYGGRWKMKGIAAKRRNSTPNANDVYMEKKNTTG